MRKIISALNIKRIYSEEKAMQSFAATKGNCGYYLWWVLFIGQDMNTLGENDNYHMKQL